VNVLLLGGTAEARQLAEVLTGRGIAVTSSLAGDVADLRLPPGEVRVGGFGGALGLAGYLRRADITAVVNATHPFAAQISANAAEACACEGIPLLRLLRPGWSAHADAASWHWVGTLDEARSAAQRLGSRVFLTTGRQTLSVFAGWTDRYTLVRVVDPPAFEVPATWEVLRARGPFSVATEVDLMAGRRIDVLVTKDSGGRLTAAKLEAAARLGVLVVALRRPEQPRGVPVVESGEAAAAWVLGH